jgi:putative transposase
MVAPYTKTSMVSAGISAPATLIPVTNAIEALNSKLRRAVRARGHFPNDDAATKLLYLILNRSEKEWKMPPREWSMAKAQFAVIFGERFIRAMAA